MSTLNTYKASPYFNDFSKISKSSRISQPDHYTKHTSAGDYEDDQDIMPRTLSIMHTQRRGVYWPTEAGRECIARAENEGAAENCYSGGNRMLEVEADRWDVVVKADHDETQSEEELEEVEEPPPKKAKIAAKADTNSPYFALGSEFGTTSKLFQFPADRNRTSSARGFTNTGTNWSFPTPCTKTEESGAEFQHGKADRKTPGGGVVDEDYGEETRHSYRGIPAARSETPGPSNKRKFTSASLIRENRASNPVDFDLAELALLAETPTTSPHTPVKSKLDIPTITVTQATPDIYASTIKRKRAPPVLARHLNAGLKPLQFRPPSRNRFKHSSSGKTGKALLGNMRGRVLTGATWTEKGFTTGSLQSDSAEDSILTAVQTDGVGTFQCLPALFFSALGVVLRENSAIDDLARLNVCSRSIYHATKQEFWRDVCIPHEGANWNDALQGWNKEERAGVEA